MPARAGYFPWNNFQAVQGNTGTKNSYTHGEMQWDLSSGWHFKRGKGWHNKFRKEQRMRPVMGTDGQVYYVRAYEGDYDDQIGFHASDNPDEMRVAYAERAFSNPDNIKSSDGVGHIAKVEYALTQQILRVTFANNGSVCLFFRVPNAVAGTLLKFAKDKTVARRDKRGNERHALGILFWDYIRIRGHQHGAKYPWEYEVHSQGKITNSKNRHVLRFDTETEEGRNIAKALVMDNTEASKRLAAQLQTFGGNKGEVTVVLNDEEYEKLGTFITKTTRADSADSPSFEWIAEKETEDGNKIEVNSEASMKYNPEAIFFRGLETNETNRPIMGSGRAPGEDIAQAYLDYAAQGRAAAEGKLRDAKLAWEADPSHYAQMNARAEAIYNDKQRKGYKKIDRDSTEDQAFYDMYKKFGPQGLAEILRLKGKGSYIAHITQNNDIESVKKILKEAFGSESIKSWVNKNLPAKYAARFTGRLWTPEDLKNMANSSLPDGISLKDSIPYKRLIAANDWQGALNFLKSHKGDLVFIDKTGHERKLSNQPYASQYDMLAEEE